jgi:hypothetical protein
MLKIASFMDNLPDLLPVPFEPSEEEIRAYAYSLYQQGGHTPGHDIANWLEATAYLKANLPPKHPAPGLPPPVNQPNPVELQAVTLGARTFLS